VEAIWVATPTQFHATHARLVAERAKHVVVEKPFAITLDECEQMIEAAVHNGVALIAGGCRSFDPAFVAMRRVIESDRLGPVGALSTWSFTDWIIRPREPYEVDVTLGGGTIYNQAAHPVDVLRLLGGGMVRSVRSMTGQWMVERPCPGYFTALLEFEDGTPATLTYNGHGYISSWELVPWGETPERRRSSEATAAYRRALQEGTADEYAAREARRYGGHPASSADSGDGNWTPSDAGMVVASCARGEIRQSARGLYVYDGNGRHDEPISSAGGMRLNEVTDLRNAISGEAVPLHDGRWGMATIEVLLAIIQSAAEHREVVLHRQVPVAR
jgi:phthalate 4,5-cis-dihydrodiol dehydrogenase